jgi:small-conductance mechanosensitive channel
MIRTRTTQRIALVIVCLVAMALLLPACDAIVTTEEPVVTTGTPSSTSTSFTATPAPRSTLDTITIERTPVPTAIAGPLQQEVEQMVARAGLSATKIFGLRVTEWINLLLAAFYMLIGYLISVFVVRRGLHRFVKRAPAGLDSDLLDKISSSLSWLIVLLFAQIAFRRITFFSGPLRILLGDIFFVLSAIIIYQVVSQSVGLADQWYRQKSVEEDREEELGPVITLLVRVGRVIFAIIVITIVLGHFGVNVTALAAALGIGGLAISLAARDTIADAIAGFIILVDRPFRIGDRIEIQGVGTWGDVTDIGLRTTRIRTRDNRMVIVPNSIIGSNQVINYTYPDPRYRIETHVGVAYGTDIEHVRALLIDTVKGLEFVLPDKPVDALYIDMGDSAMIFRVRWWIESYVDTRRATDRVHTAIQKALDEAGIDCPFPTQSLDMQFRPETIEQFSQALKGSGKGSAESPE